MASLQKALGYRIRSLRKSCRLSQEQLGERANLHNTYIGAIERGERNPSLKTLEKIAQALNVQVSDLFKFMGSEASPQEERLKAEIFSMLEGQEAKTIRFILNLIKQATNDLNQFLT
jgi:transcriptional regulator with XRE-family HTH domain